MIFEKSCTFTGLTPSPVRWAFPEVSTVFVTAFYTENIIEYGKKIDENRKKEHNSRNTKEQTMKSKNSLPALFYFMNEKEGN